MYKIVKYTYKKVTDQTHPFAKNVAQLTLLLYGCFLSLSFVCQIHVGMNGQTNSDWLNCNCKKTEYSENLKLALHLEKSVVESFSL